MHVCNASAQLAYYAAGGQQAALPVFSLATPNFQTLAGCKQACLRQVCVALFTQAQRLQLANCTYYTSCAAVRCTICCSSPAAIHNDNPSCVVATPNIQHSSLPAHMHAHCAGAGHQRRQHTDSFTIPKTMLGIYICPPYMVLGTHNTKSTPFQQCGPMGSLPAAESAAASASTPQQQLPTC